MSDRIARLKAEIKLAELEEELSRRKGTGKTPKLVDPKFKLKVRNARAAFRNKYRPQVNANPDAVGVGASVSETGTA